ncbi:MAG TPA: hypothetical protein PK431_14225 [Chitinophagales bacterium]|nr:hypothetical protein [Chitinophagales bacterium]
MGNPILSILIVTLEKRKNFFDRLINQLVWQQRQLPNPDDVEFIIAVDNGEKTTGFKTNLAIQQSNGQYVCRADDDDNVTDVYLKKQLDVAKSGADCGEFRGLYFLNGVYDRPFHHSIEYSHWWQDDKAYRRNPNHLSCIRKDLIIDIPYEDITVGEDGRFSEALQASGRIKNQYPVNETLYLYFDRTKVDGI